MSLLIVDRIVAFFFSIICVLIIVASHDMRGGAGVMPVAIAALGLVTSVMLFIQKRSTEEEKNSPINWVRFVIWSSLSIIAIVSIKDLGAFISIPIFLFLSFYVLGRVGLNKSIFISAMFSAFIYFTFVKLLEVPLPNGILSNWLNM